MKRARTKQTKTRLLGVAVVAAATLAASPLVFGKQPSNAWSTNSAKQAILGGGTIVAKRIDSADTTQYCDVASTPGTHFTWVDTAGGLDYTHAWALWAASCPTAVATMRGAEVLYVERVEPVSGAIPTQESQRELAEAEIQKATDGGAIVVMIPVDTPEQARQAVRRAYYPPLGARRLGPGQFDQVYAGVTADYRGTYNDNLVLIAIVSTVEGADQAKEIARVEGIHAVFLDAMNLESSSGYVQDSKQYDMLAQAVRSGAQAAQKHLCTADRSAVPHTLTCVRHPTGKQ
jgi:hypothetical protein